MTNAMNACAKILVPAAATLVVACGGASADSPTANTPDTSRTSGTTIRATQLTVGGGHTCVITAVGAAYCWGSGAFGQLGNGGAPLPHSGNAPSADYPVAVVGGLKFASISAGYVHTCALTGDGKAYCWGFNYESDEVRGALGDGTDNNRGVPTAVVGGLTFKSIVAGGHHTCGITQNGETDCWGRNASGELGTGDLSGVAQLSPVRVPAVAFTQLALGYKFSCGLTAAGQAYCWGNNEAGELGDGTQSARQSPTAVIGGATYTELSGSVFQLHTCGLRPDGTADCWGENVSGELGDGTTSPHDAPIAIAGGLKFISVSSGDYHSCGLTAAGQAYCWGNNAQGELGTGTTTDSKIPVAVSGSLTFTQLGAGGDHTCGLTADGVVYCWGQAGYVGDGANVNRTVPTKVLGF